MMKENIKNQIRKSVNISPSWINRMIAKLVFIFLNKIL